MKIKAAAPALLLASMFFIAGCACHAPYISKAIKTPPQPIDAWQDFQGELGQMDIALQSAKAKAEKSTLLNGIQENIQLVVDGKAAFTAVFDKGKITIEKGITPGVEVTMTLPVTLQNIQNLDKALDDGKLDDQELYNFSYVLFVPCIRRMFAMPYLFGHDISAAKMHNFLQLTIKNPGDLSFHGQKVDIQATLVNVDGMFMAYPGFQGDPDARLAFTVSQAQDIYKLAVYDYFRDKGDDGKINANIKRYLAMIDSATVYTRSWH